MKNLLGSVIVLGPASPNVSKFQLTRPVAAMLALAVFISLFIVIAAAFWFPTLSEGVHSQLENENQKLRIANMNLAIGAERLDDAVLRLEEQQKRVTELIESE